MQGRRPAETRWMCLICLIMKWYLVITYISLVVCIAGCLYHVIQIIGHRKPRDFSKSADTVGSAIRYSFTKAMNPARKESAYLHVPTYIAGMLYHLGTFLSGVLLFVFLFSIDLYGTIELFISVFLMVSILCGTGILVKRIFSKLLREITVIDDYISNILVTAFQVCTLVYIHFSLPVYYIAASALLLYIPFGKLRHAVYFFAARYYLGLFYGHRGTWPPIKH
jgi:nitrate reductase gamma subunit